MRILKYLIIGSAATIALVPVSAQEYPSLLGELFKALSGKKPAAAGSPQTAQEPVGRGQFNVVMTPEQTAGLQAALAAKIMNPVIAREFEEARPLIEKLITIGACGTSKAAWNAINVDSLTPKTYSDYGWLSTVGGSQYHDKRYCYDVQRVGEWQKAAKNALSFKSFYVSGLSGEAAQNSFELIKTPEGRWLVLSIG